MRMIIGMIFVIIACMSAYQKGFLSNFSLLDAVVLVYLAVSGSLLLRKISMCMLKSEALYKPEKVMEKNRPFYINKTMWDDIFNTAVQHKKDQDRFCRYIKKIRQYARLKEPDHNNDEKWRSLIYKTFEY